MSIPLIAAGIYAGSSLLSEFLRKSSEKKAREEILKQLEKSKITEEEKNKMLSELDRNFSTTALNAVNSNVLGLQSVLNKDVAKGLLGAKLLGERASQRLQLIGKIDEFNKRVELEKAKVPTPEEIDITSVLTGGLMGYIFGTRIEDLMGNKSTFTTNPSPNAINNQSNINQNLLKPDVGVGTTLPSTTINVNLDNLVKFDFNRKNNKEELFDLDLGNVLKKYNFYNRG